MSNGTGSGFPGSGSIPDLEQPPAYIEGPGGGPATPFGGGGLSHEEKDAYDEASDNANYYAAGTAGVAAVATFTTAGGGLVFGVMSAGFWLTSQYFSDMAEDPPQSHEQIVTFQPRLCRPPAMNDPILSHSGIAIQRAVFAMVTARGLLDALERLASAQQAGDLNWTVTHYGVASQCYQTLVVDVATLASAIYAAGQALSGSEFDLPLKPAAGGVREWIESPGMEAKILKAMREAGFLNAEFKAVVEWWKTDPKYSGPETTCSKLLLSWANKLYTSAQTLALTGRLFV